MQHYRGDCYPSARKSGKCEEIMADTMRDDNIWRFRDSVARCQKLKFDLNATTSALQPGAIQFLTSGNIVPEAPDIVVAHRVGHDLFALA